MYGLQERSWGLLLTVLLLQKRKYNKMLGVVCVLYNLFEHISQLPSYHVKDPSIYRLGKSIFVFTMI